MADEELSDIDDLPCQHDIEYDMEDFMELDDDCDEDELDMHHVVADGDVIFVVGRDKHRVQVYSSVMKEASPVFAAMLGPHFNEGQKLLKNGSVTVELPDDSSMALTWICRALHGEVHGVPPLTPEKLSIIAEVSDKYDMNKALSDIVGHWVGRMCSEDDKHSDFEAIDLWHILIATYQLDSPQGFSKISKRCLFKIDGRFSSIAREIGTGDLGFRIACGFPLQPVLSLMADFCELVILEQTKSALRYYISFKMIRTVVDVTNCRCDSQMIKFAWYVADLWESTKWGLDGPERLEDENLMLDFLAEFTRDAECECDCPVESKQYFQDAWDALRRFQGEVDGLCLRCLQEGQHQEIDEECEHGKLIIKTFVK